MRIRIGFYLLAALLLASSLSGQYTTQQISGTVRDSSGAVVVGATVTAFQPATGLRRQTVTSDSGFYAVANIPIGEYEVEVESTGFKRYR